MSRLLAATWSAFGQSQPTPVAATPENAAAFLGEWTVTATGLYGPTTLTLTLKAADAKVAGEVTSANGKQPITEVSRTGPSLVLRYVFDYQGMPINAVITLTPGDKQIDAHLDFADGAALFVGTASKKQS